MGLRGKDESGRMASYCPRHGTALMTNMILPKIWHRTYDKHDTAGLQVKTPAILSLCTINGVGLDGIITIRPLHHWGSLLWCQTLSFILTKSFLIIPLRK